VLNPVWVALFYGEEPTAATVIGGAIILAGLGVRYGAMGVTGRAREPPVEPPHPGV
jgi:hypothetical protein